MRLAYPIQKFQDWFTQQWVIFRGVRINPQDNLWLMGPFGNLNGNGDDFIKQLAEKENLSIERNADNQSLIPSFELLKLPDITRSGLSKKVISFYEHTAQYKLCYTLKWNPVFRWSGIVVNRLFSRRINQLNIPSKNILTAEPITSELITLSDPVSNQVKYTVWLRKSSSNGQIIYSGIYGTCTLPSGRTCVKAIFPLPNGNATVIMSPEIGKNGELILDSSGRKFGDEGFYFLLNDSKGNCWSQYIRSFRDRLIIREKNDLIVAEQVLTLWHQEVLRFNYTIEVKE